MRFLALISVAVSLLTACTSQTPSPVENIFDEVDKLNQNRTSQEQWQNGVANLASGEQLRARMQAKYGKEIDNSFKIPRDKNGKVQYSKIARSSYKARKYMVKQGDSLYLISYISGQSVDEIARLNNLQKPYNLAVGQIILLNPQASNTNIQERTLEPDVSDVSVEPKTEIVAKRPTSNSGEMTWQWPTKGKVIATFSPADGGNKGIDIAGRQGQPVYAVASGQVVYAGNALQGYGNLIIIKHNNDYLTAYAHNQTILVKDKQYVTAGQEIAKMGSTGTDRVKLHFEVRYKGQSADPMKFLPKQ